MNTNLVSRPRAGALAAALAIALVGPVTVRGADAPVAPASVHATAHAQVGVHRYRLGNFEITALSDGTVPLDTHALLRGAPLPKIDGALAGAFQSNPVETSINAFLIDTGSRKVLVDTGAGDLFGPGNAGRLMSSLQAAGVDPDRIDDVLLTHIHTDHSGGLMHEGHVVFANAKVHVGKPDVDFFLAPGNQRGVNGYDKAYFEQASASLSAYRASGQLKPFQGRTELLPGIMAIPAPGHTPGHSVYRVQSNGESITFIGDLVHVQSVQFPQPSVTILYDVDQPAAATQRQARFAEFAANRERVAGAHLPFPGIGHIERKGEGFAFVAEDYRYR